MTHKDHGRASIDCCLLEDYVRPRNYGRQGADRARSDHRLEHRHALARQQREERHVHVKYAVLTRRSHERDFEVIHPPLSHRQLASLEFDILYSKLL